MAYYEDKEYYVPRRTPIDTVSRSNRFSIRIIGKVIMSSGVQDWDSVHGNGQKLFFDVADETGIIRVFAWDAAAVKAGNFIRRGRFVEIIDVFVDPRNVQFNNISHPFEIQLTSSSIINILPNNTSMKIIREKPVFVSFLEVPNFRKNEYFNVKGTISEVYPVPPSEGIGIESQNHYTKQAVEIQDDEGNVLRIMNWNDWIPLLDEYTGRTLSLIRCKYIPEFQNINASGALALIDGEQIN